MTRQQAKQAARQLRRNTRWTEDNGARLAFWLTLGGTVTGSKHL